MNEQDWGLDPEVGYGLGVGCGGSNVGYGEGIIGVGVYDNGFTGG